MLGDGVQAKNFCKSRRVLELLDNNELKNKELLLLLTLCGLQRTRLLETDTLSLAFLWNGNMYLCNSEPTTSAGIYQSFVHSSL